MLRGAPSFGNSLKVFSFETDTDHYLPPSKWENQIFETDPDRNLHPSKARPDGKILLQ